MRWLYVSTLVSLVLVASCTREIETATLPDVEMKVAGVGDLLIMLAGLGVIFGGMILYFGRQSKARKNAEFIRLMQRSDQRIIPWHLLDGATRGQIEGEQRQKIRIGAYAQARQDFTDLAPHLAHAAALKFPPPPSITPEDEEYARVKFAELMIQTIRPELERLGIELPDDDDIELYFRLNQLSQLARDGRIELAQVGMKEDFMATKE